MPLRAKTTRGKVSEQAGHLMAKSPKFSRREAYGVATRIVTGRGPKKKGRKKMPRHGRKRYEGGGYSEKHMDRGASYANAPQGYRSDAGKPMGYYGKPPNGYIDQTGMPNAKRRKALMHMMNQYGGGEGAMAMAGNPGGHYGTSSTNAGTSPSEGSMDPTYRGGKMSHNPGMSHKRGKTYSRRMR